MEGMVSLLFQLNKTIGKTIARANVKELEFDVNDMQQSIKVISDRVNQVIVEFDNFHGEFMDRKTASTLFQPKLKLAKRVRATAEYGIDVKGGNESVRLGMSANQICWLESFFIQSKYIRKKHDAHF